MIFVVLQQHLRIKYQDDHPQILAYRHQLVTKCCFRVAKAKPHKENYQITACLTGDKDPPGIFQGAWKYLVDCPTQLTLYDLDLSVE